MSSMDSGADAALIASGAAAQHDAFGYLDAPRHLLNYDRFDDAFLDSNCGYF